MMKDGPSPSLDAAQTQVGRTRLSFAAAVLHFHAKCARRVDQFAQKIICKWMRASDARRTHLTYIDYADV